MLDASGPGRPRPTDAASPLTLEGDGPRGQGVVLSGGPAGLQQQGEQSAGQPHVTGGRVTMEQGPGAGWAVVTVMLAGREKSCLLSFWSFSPGGREGWREEGVEEEPGGGRLSQLWVSHSSPLPLELLCWRIYLPGL